MVAIFLRMPIGDAWCLLVVTKVRSVSRQTDIAFSWLQPCPSHHSSDEQFDCQYGRGKTFSHLLHYRFLRHHCIFLWLIDRWPRLASVFYCFQYDGAEETGMVLQAEDIGGDRWMKLQHQEHFHILAQVRSSMSTFRWRRYLTANWPLTYWNYTSLSYCLH